MNNLLKEYVDKFNQVETVKQYDELVQNLNKSLYNKGFDSTIRQVIKEKQKYMKNKFSDEVTKDSMLKAKESLIVYLEGLLYEDTKDIGKESQEILKEYLHDFYFFLEAFREIEPHKKSTLDFKVLQSIKIENEYDLQHLLYSVLKPLCKDTRVEVSEDTGCGTVRADIKIPSLNTIIETKCTRKNMSFKKLTEEIEADIVHYKAEFIYFYIYDKEKIIKDREAFERTFNRKFDGKKIEVIILQPMNL